ncbi:hypothetical protein LEP1GSC186_3276 [Leptospira noguchii serovar Autumnalis str. ZUN142]|uniref:Uncharacterized protein n=2 Tax=Leptospira noguchii TaxID=28182 RepID=M6U3E2_9LEPT|nr:hypothetical protein LEP1GSC186_3276 [Leptospira noguchii serovar Autumnalis str. ZUN142]
MYFHFYYPKLMIVATLIKELYPFFYLLSVFVVARFITKNANLDIKKRELMFSVAKDFENRIENLFEKIKVILGDNSLDVENGRRIQIDLKVISNIFSIISLNLEKFLKTEIYIEACQNYNELRDLIADIELFYRKNPGTVEKDLINLYSKFIGSFIKLKFDLLNEKKWNIF